MIPSCCCLIHNPDSGLAEAVEMTLAGSLLAANTAYSIAATARKQKPMKVFRSFIVDGTRSDARLSWYRWLAWKQNRRPAS
jgi:hypothetical protein